MEKYLEIIIISSIVYSLFFYSYKFIKKLDVFDRPMGLMVPLGTEKDLKLEKHHFESFMSHFAIILLSAFVFEWYMVIFYVILLRVGIQSFILLIENQIIERFFLWYVGYVFFYCKWINHLILLYFLIAVVFKLPFGYIKNE